MLFAFVQCWEHEGHNGRHIVTDETQDVFIIPKIQGSLCNLGNDIRQCCITDTRSLRPQLYTKKQGVLGRCTGQILIFVSQLTCMVVYKIYHDNNKT